MIFALLIALVAEILKPLKKADDIALTILIATFVGLGLSWMITIAHPASP